MLALGSCLATSLGGHPRRSTAGGWWVWGFFCNANDEEALMRHRMVQLYFVVLALTFFVSAPALAARTHKGAEAKTHKGKVVEAGGGKLTMTDMTGKNQRSEERRVGKSVDLGG